MAATQLQVNKNTTSDTASVLLQTASSGRAEIGAIGDDNLHIRVSPDGSGWNDAIVITNTTGAASFPNTGGFTGDTGAGGSSGLVPAPAAGMAAAGKYLKADGTWAIPAGAPQVNADWNATSGVAQILNKPSIPAAQVNSDWNATSGAAQILNKPVLAASATVDTTNAANIVSGTLSATQLPLFSSSANGAVSASAGGTANFLRADGAWTVPQGTPSGSSLQLQYNNAGLFGGMAGTSWNQANQALALTSSGSTGSATLSLTKGGNESSLIDLYEPTGTQHGKILRVLEPGDVSSLTPVTYIGNGGEIKTRAWITVSGVSSGTGDGYSITDPLNSATYPQMLSVWADVPYALTLRTAPVSGAFNIVALDRNAGFRFMMPEDGSLSWGPSTASTPGGIDTSLARTGAGKLALGNGVSGDYSGNLKLTTLTFGDGSTQTTAAASGSVFTGATSGAAGMTGLVPAPAAGQQNSFLRGDATWGTPSVSGLTIASGKTFSVNNSLTLAGTDGKTLTVNNNLAFAGTDGTTMSLPAVSSTLAGVGNINTWSSQQNFAGNLQLANNTGIFGALNTSGNTLLFNFDNANNFVLGSAGISTMVFFAGSNQEVRFLNHNGANRIMSLQESTSRITFGNNGGYYDSSWTFFDGTATTGDSVISIRDGAARAARVRFGANSGGSTYDVGFTRNASGVLAITDASTTLTNYRDLKLRNLYSGANQVVTARQTGWGAPSGTVTRSSLAAYAGQTAGSAYSQTVAQTTDNAVAAVSQTLAALITDLTTHGLIGA